jgi:hypothetical protein
MPQENPTRLKPTVEIGARYLVLSETHPPSDISRRATPVSRIGNANYDNLIGLTVLPGMILKEDSLANQNQPPDGSMPLMRRYVTRLP